MGVDAHGNIVAADWQTYGQAQSNIDEMKRLLGTTTWPAQPGSGGINPSDSAIYTRYSTNRRVLAKTQPLYGGALKCNYLRAPSAPQSYFASEQIVDEVAHAIKMDPIAFRRQNIDPTTVAGARWLAVLDGSTQAAGWKPKVAASNLQSGNIVTGRGVALGSYASTMVAEVADITVNKKTGKITVNNVYVAQDTGFSQYVGGIQNQGEGSVVQGASRALFEEVTFNKSNVTSLDWVSYPIMRFKDSPKIKFAYVQRTDIPAVQTGTVQANGTSVPSSTVAASGVYSSGSGEPPISCIGAAIANAFYDATGVRLREAPMTPARVRATLKAAGVA
jgi:CO/xanthine dehydrogenase Mo-binding subunit